MGQLVILIKNFGKFVNETQNFKTSEMHFLTIKFTNVKNVGCTDSINVEFDLILKNSKKRLSFTISYIFLLLLENS